MVNIFPALLRGIIGMLVVVAICLGIKSVVVVNNWFSFFVVLSSVGMISCILNVFVIFGKNDRMIVFEKVKSKVFKHK